MRIKDIKAEARRKLAVNMHQAVAVYALEYVVLVTIAALMAMSVLCLGTANIAAIIVIICFSVAMAIFVLVIAGMVNFAMVDFYLVSYRCKPYNIRRLGDTLARSGVFRIMSLNVRRAIIGLFLTALFIVPGIIYLVRTSMANPLLIANPKMSGGTALKASSKVMGSRSGSYFVLCASFTIWILIGLCTLGAAFIFIAPYMNLAKIVYYKRNLQGDRTVYKVPVQPVSPPQQQPQPVYSMPFQPQVREIGGGNNKVEPDSATAIPPIATLATEDMAEMHAAMRDIDSDVPEVPEVAIGPVKTTKRKGGNKSDSTNLVESVKTLSTQEVKDADILSKKIKELYSPDKVDHHADKDYFSNFDSDNDSFFTDEDDDRGEVDVSGDEDSPEGEPLLSEKEFEDFMKEFDVPTQDADFVPLTRSDGGNQNGNADEPQENAEEDNFDEEQQDFAEDDFGEEPQENAEDDFGEELQEIEQDSLTGEPQEFAEDVTEEPQDVADEPQDNAEVNTEVPQEKSEESVEVPQEKTESRRGAERPIRTEHVTARVEPLKNAQSQGSTDLSREERLAQIRRERDERLKKLKNNQ